MLRNSFEATLSPSQCPTWPGEVGRQSAARGFPKIPPFPCMTTHSLLLQLVKQHHGLAQGK